MISFLLVVMSERLQLEFVSLLAYFVFDINHLNGTVLSETGSPKSKRRMWVGAQSTLDLCRIIRRASSKIDRR